MANTPTRERDLSHLDKVCRYLEEKDLALLHALKAIITEALLLFEAHEGRTMEHGDALLELLRQIPHIISIGYNRLGKSTFA